MSQSINNMSVTWSDGSLQTGIKLNVTDTSSNAASNLLDLQVGGDSLVKVSKQGNIDFSTGGALQGSIARRISGVALQGPNGLTLAGLYNSHFGLSSIVSLGWSEGYNTNSPTANWVFLARDAANTLAQRNGTNAQAFRIYNTFTDASNYERGIIAWDTNVLKIGTENLGTGTARALEFQTDGTTRLTIAAAGGLLAEAGSVSAVSYGTRNAGSGMYSRAANALTFALDGINRIEIQSTTVAIGGQILLSGNANPLTAGNWTAIHSDANNTLAVREGTNAQAFRVYGTYTAADNFQRVNVAVAKVASGALSGASVTLTGAIPAGAVVVGVTSRVTTLLTGAAGYEIGTSADADRFGDITGTAVGTVSKNSDWTAGTIECFPAATDVVLTAKTSNFTAGAIEVCISYMQGDAD